MADVASLDATVLAWDRWMGCILCPYPAGSEEKVNLLEKGEVVLFYKRKATEPVIVIRNGKCIFGNECLSRKGRSLPLISTKKS